MTPKQGAAVVELLRCSAYCAASDRYSFLFEPGQVAATFLGVDKTTVRWAKRAARAAGARPTFDVGEYITVTLEAAARVEEGSWP